MKFCCLWLVSPIPSWNGNMDLGLVLFWLENFVFRFRIFKVLTGQRFFCSVMDARKFLSFFWKKNFDRFFLSFICYVGGPSILHRGYNMAAWGYEFYLRVLKVSPTRSLRSLVRDTFSTRKMPVSKMLWNSDIKFIKKNIYNNNNNNNTYIFCSKKSKF